MTTTNDVTEKHNKSIASTYLTVTIAFLCMIGINVYSYFTIMNMSKIYSTQSKAAVEFKQKMTSANLLFREIMSDSTSKDMNEVWIHLDKAKEQLRVMSGLKGIKKIEDELETYRQILLKYYRAKDTPGIKAKDLKDIHDEYNSSFDKLNLNTDGLEGELQKMIDAKIELINILYGVLIFNIVLIFAFVVYTFARYIKRRKEAENQLLTTKDNLDTVLNSLDSILVSIDKQKIITQWNDAAEKYFKLKREQVLDQPITEAIPFIKEYITNIEKVFHSKAPQELYRERIPYNRSERYFNIALNYTQGNTGIVIRIEDVTVHEMKDEQMRQSQKMEVVENLIGGLAHDFNNVLGAITGTISMMRYSTEGQNGTSENLTESINLIESSAERATVMVSQLLSLSQKQEIKLEPLDLNLSIRHILKILENTIDKRVEITAELYSSKVLVEADSGQIAQALLNLCDNASQAMTVMRKEGEHKGGKLNISIDKYHPDKNFRDSHPHLSDGPYWVVEVSDTGIGMDEETRSRVFDPFFSTKDDSEGSGMGLTMVNEIINRHHGIVELQSELGKGSVFKLYLPEYKSKPKLGQVEAEEVEFVEQKEKIPVGSGLVLVVDDEEIMRKTAGNILTKLGYDVIFAEDGEQAVEVYKENYQKVQVTLLDMAMPKMSGKEAYLEMRKINPDLKSLLVSGFKKDKRITEALELGVNGFVQKPYQMTTLAQEVKRLINWDPNSDGELITAIVAPDGERTTPKGTLIMPHPAPKEDLGATE
jgi:PAS domain S-box-containing protein